MSGVEVPAELIERVTARFAEMNMALCSEFHDTSMSELPTCDEGTCPDDRALAAELRALLPQPAPTCPNCGDKDTRHGGGGCEALLCDCWLSRKALPQVRALLAAERDSNTDAAAYRDLTGFAAGSLYGSEPAEPDAVDAAVRILIRNEVQS